MDMFSQAKRDLEQLNTEIDAEIAENKTKIADLQAENADLLSLKTSNENSIKSFVKIFKV